MPNPPLVVANAVQVRLMYSMSGNGAFNVIHARKLGTQTIDQALTNTVGVAIKAAWQTHIGPLVGISTALARVGLRDLSAPNRPEFLDTGALVQGSGTGDPLPVNVACVVTLRTAGSGKSLRGRVYVGGFTEGQNDTTGSTAGTASAGSVAYLQAVSAALTASGMTLGVLSRPAYAFVDNRTWTLPAGETEVDVIGRGNARDGAINDVTLIQSRNNTWESQRRRGNGRGAAPALFTPLVSVNAQ